MHAVCRTAVRTAVFCVCGLLLTLALSAVAHAATLTNIYDFSDQFSLDDVEFEGLSFTDDGALWIASMPDDGDPQLISVDLSSLSVLTQATYSNAVTGDAFGGWLTSPFNPVALASDGTNLFVGSNGKSTYLYSYLYTTDSSGALADDPIQFSGSACNDPEGAAYLNGTFYVTCEESDTVVMLNSDGSVDELLSGFTALGLAATDSALIIGDYDNHELILYDVTTGEETERIDLAELFPDYELVDIDGETHTVPDPDGLAYWDGKIYMSFEFDLRVFEISLEATPTPTPTPTPTATPTATPTPAPDPITFTKTGDGRGSILVNSEVVCDADCTETQVPYIEGETLTIDATPESDSTFDGWLINGETVSGAATIVSGDTVTAIFSLIAAPTADFTASPLRGYAPLTVTVRSTSQGEIDAYAWDFGDPSTGSGQGATEDPASHTYESAGAYDVSLTVDNGGGSDTLTQSDLIEVLRDNQTPVVTIGWPEAGAVGSGSVEVSGTIVDDGALEAVLVNDVIATVTGDAENGYSFSVTIELENGNQMISVSAEDDGGAFGFAEQLVRVDGEGPEIDIDAPQSGAAVDSLTPSLAISFSDFLSEVDPDSVEITLTDADGTSTDLSGDLTIAASGASGTLDEVLNEDSSYTLNVTVSDSLGNSSQASSLFYVPVDPDDIVAPEEAEDAGWIVGTVYDSSTCPVETHGGAPLQGCSGLAGALVTVAYGGEAGEEVAGTIVTGPEGDFQFPVSETNIYWLRVEKDDYTYGQREVEVVRERAIATSDIYLTPLDTNVSYCDSTGCSHESADGLMQVEIPEGAIADGTTVEVRATNFSHVEFLPSGELPPGTAETYAFALGNDLVQERVDFLTPVTVKLQNTREFAAGEEIPLGWWNPDTQIWEHAGTGTVDENCEWLVMEVEHFSVFDCNDPVSPPEEADTEEKDRTGDEPEQCSPPDCAGCAQQTGDCTIDAKSGVFTEDYRLPSLSVLGRNVAPQLLYSSRRVMPSTVIDLSLTMEAFEDSDAQVGDTMTYELFLNGEKRDRVTSAFQVGQENRFRSFWEGRDLDGEWLAPGIYEYEATLSVPYRTQYYYSTTGRFGGPPDYDRPTGVYVTHTVSVEHSGTLTIDSQPDSAFGVGWVLAGQQRLYEDEAGRILIADGRNNDEFYYPNTNQLRAARRGISERLVWTNAGSGTIQSMETSTGLTTSIEVGDGPLGLALSSDGTNAYVALEEGESLAVVNLDMDQLLGSVATDLMPANVALSPDDAYAYIVHWGSQTLQIVNTGTRQIVDSILVEGYGDGWSDLAIAPDGRYAYLVGRYYSNTVAIVDLEAREVVGGIESGEQPSDIVLSPDGTLAYVTNEKDNSVSILDLNQWQKTAEIPVGAVPSGIALSANGSTAYVTNSSNGTVSVVDLDSRSVTDTIAVGLNPQGIVVTEDGSTAYVVNNYSNTISVLDLEAKTKLTTIDTGSRPMAVTLTVTAAPGIYSMSGSDDSTLEYDGTSYTRVYPNGTRVLFDDNDRHASTVDRLGNTTSYTYNDDNTTATMSITPAGGSDPAWTWTFAYSGGALDTITDPAGRVTSFSIDANNHLTSATLLPSSEGSGVGYTRNFVYDSQGLMTQESDEAGNMTTHVYDSYGRITDTRKTARATTDSSSGATSAASQSTHFTTVDTGYTLLNEISFSDPDSPAATPPDSDALIAKVDYARGGLEGTMDKWGRWLSKTDAEGNTTRFERDSGGNLTQQTFPDGSCVVYQYNLLGKMLAKARMEADQCALDEDERDTSAMQITAYTYVETDGGLSLLKTVADPEGNVTTYIYDYEEDAGDDGNLIRIEYPEVEDENGDSVTPSVSYSDNAAGQVTTVTDEAGTVTRYVYTSGSEDEAYGEDEALFAEDVSPVPGLLTQVIKDAEDVAQTTTYSDFTALGKPGTVTGPSCCGGGTVTYYTYDDLGRVLTKTDALGIVTTYAYDAAGNVEQTVADYTEDGSTGRNIVTEYTYDADNHLLTARSEADGLLRETTYAYDEQGQLASVTDPNGNTTTYSYTDSNRLESVTDALSQTTSYSYTENGKLETVTLPNGTIVKYVYNGLGQKVQQIEDLGGLSLVTSYTYYPNGDLHIVTDPEQKTTTYSYDALGRVKTVQDHLLQDTTYAYDSAGNLRSLTDAKTQTSGFSYNGLGRITGESRPMGESTSYVYNASGKLETTTDAKNQRTEYLYEDGTNLLTDIYSFDSSETQTGHVSFSYERGQLSGYSDGEISASYTYNAFGQKLSETVNYPGFSKTFLYGYDNSGHKQYFTMPDGGTVSYSYDKNELRNIRIPGAGNISYPSYTLGRPDSMSSPGGTRSYSYDALARTTNITAPGMNYSYSDYDKAGNILTKQTGDGTYEYEYDDLYRLTDVTDPVSDDEAYTYDAVGNRLTASGITGSIDHNANNELELYGDISFAYDANGNMTAKTSASVDWAYGYNVQNRLIRVEEDDLLVAEYGYDPFGRRLWKEVDGTRTYFLYADEGLVAEYDEDGTELRSYGYRSDSIWGTDPLWMKEGGEYYWYQNDHLGTPQKLVDSSGTVVWSATYSAFGEAQIDVETVINNLRFPGQYFDEETGLHYNWFRYYDPEIGRYPRVDPIGFSGQDVNLYAYVWSNPIFWSDSRGLKVINNSGPWILNDKGELVKNDGSSCRAYVKPGGRDDAPPGREDITLPGEDAYGVPAGTCFVEPYQDGAGSPDNPDHPDDVLKTRGRMGIGMDVTVNPDCSFDYNWFLSSWKDLEWQQDNHGDWEAVFKAVTTGETTDTGKDTVFSEILKAMQEAQ